MAKRNREDASVRGSVQKVRSSFGGHEEADIDITETFIEGYPVDAAVRASKDAVARSSCENNIRRCP